MQKLLEGLYGIIQNQYQVDYKHVIRIYDNYAKNAKCKTFPKLLSAHVTC